MIVRYDKVWPNNPFIFNIPCQKPNSQASSNRKYIYTPSDIKSTVLNLLLDLDDDEWVYWCIDDKYPVCFDLDRVKQIHEWIKTITDTDISGILFCRCRQMLESEYLTGATIHDNKGLVYLERKGYDQIWIHQYLRVKVIRHLFNNFPDVITGAKKMDDYKDELAKPANHRLFVTEDNYSVFGESTTKGRLTTNCYESIMESSIKLPFWFSTKNKHHITMGEL